MSVVTSSDAAAALVDEVWRAEGGRLLGALARRLGDLDAAEDALQDAVAEALRSWSSEPPPNPAGWLATTAWRKAVDRLRRASTADVKLALLAAEPPAQGEQEYLLALLFGCCDPALPEDARIALTLRAACALTVEEIAAAFLSSPAAVAQRLTRAKRRLRTSGVRFAVPEPEQFAERLRAVLAVIYLLFNEGYLAAVNERAHRPDLSATALRLGRELAVLMPREAEAAGLVALMELHQARADARFDAEGHLVLLEDQDRSRWDHEEIGKAVQRLDRAMALRDPGPYQIQAAIAALHAQAPDAERTDWRQVRLLYTRLHAMTPSPVVLLSRAVATRYVLGPDAALAEAEDLGERLAGYRFFHATRADLLRCLGRRDEAAEATRRALGLAVNGAERELLARRLAELSAR